MEKNEEIERVENMAPAYTQMNVKEAIDRIEVLATCTMYEPEPEDIDELLGNTEEILELVALLRAHLGLAVPDYDGVNNSRFKA